MVIYEKIRIQKIKFKLSHDKLSFSDNDIHVAHANINNPEQENDEDLNCK